MEGQADLETVVVAEMKYNFGVRTWNRKGIPIVLPPEEHIAAVKVLNNFVNAVFQERSIAGKQFWYPHTTVCGRTFVADRESLYEVIKNNNHVFINNIPGRPERVHVPPHVGNTAYLSASNNVLLIYEPDLGNFFYLDVEKLLPLRIAAEDVSDIEAFFDDSFGLLSPPQLVAFHRAQYALHLLKHGSIDVNAKLLLCQQSDDKASLYDGETRETIELSTPHQIKRSAFLQLPKMLTCNVLGTGNANCQNNTSFIIEADRKYLVDVPATLEQMLKNNKQDISDINDVIITHAHLDHIGGLQWYLLQKINAKQKVNIYTTNEIYRQALQVITSPWIRKQAEEIINLEFLPPTSSYARGGIKIDVRENLHEEGVSTIGFKFSHKGKTLGYGGDCYYLSKGEFDKRTKFFDELLEKLKKLDPDMVEYCLTHNNFARPSGDEDNDSIFRQNVDYYNGMVEPDKELGIDVMIERFLDESTKFLYWPSFLYLKNTHALQTPLWFSDCDLIIHEAEDTNDPVHTNVKVLEALPEELKSKMYITHLPPGFRERYKGDLRVLQEGVRYRV